MSSATPSCISRDAGEGFSLYEKGDTILWALTPEGIVLHNFANRKYVELKGPEHLVWSYLDGAHSLEDIRARISIAPQAENGSEEALRKLIDSTFEQLFEGGFITKKSQ